MERIHDHNCSLIAIDFMSTPHTHAVCTNICLYWKGKFTPTVRLSQPPAQVTTSDPFHQSLTDGDADLLAHPRAILGTVGLVL